MAARAGRSEPRAGANSTNLPPSKALHHRAPVSPAVHCGFNRHHRLGDIQIGEIIRRQPLPRLGEHESHNVAGFDERGAKLLIPIGKGGVEHGLNAGRRFRGCCVRAASPQRHPSGLAHARPAFPEKCRPRCRRPRPSTAAKAHARPPSPPQMPTSSHRCWRAGSGRPAKVRRSGRVRCKCKGCPASPEQMLLQGFKMQPRDQRRRVGPDSWKP